MPTKPTNLPDEFELIASYFAPLAGRGAFELRDDAALLAVPKGKQLVITQDACVSGVHFFSDDPAQLIAKKALRVNLSDLVAKGAMPFAYSMALGLDESINEDWIAAFANGLADDQSKFDVFLTGGDTFKAPVVTISITAFGLVDEGSYKSRIGAATGDAIFVTGTIGDAALGLKVRDGSLEVEDEVARFELANAYLLPLPRAKHAQLVATFASASMDISDGLIGDIEKLCRASKCSAKIEIEKIPFSSSVASVISNNNNLLETALTGGDDYQVLFTVAADDIQKLNETAASLALSITQIGAIEDGSPQVSVNDAAGKPVLFSKNSFKHF